MLQLKRKISSACRNEEMIVKKCGKWIALAIIVLLVILVTILYFCNTSKNYHFVGSLKDETNDIKINVFITRNNTGDLINYYTDVYYTSENIVAGRLFYYKNKEKRIVLGNRLGMHDYSRKNENKKEYGEDFIDAMLNNNIYFDLCLDDLCDNVYKTVELELSELK